MASNKNQNPASEPVAIKPETLGVEGPESLASLSQDGLQEAAPSEGTRKALGAAAEIIIKRSKQVLDMAVRVTAHQPLTLSWDAVLDPDDIRRILDAVGSSSSYPPSQLVLMSSNTLETLPLARDCRKRFTDALMREGTLPTPGSELWQLAAPESPLNHLLTILSKIETGHFDDAENQIVLALDNDPSFNHPIVAEFMCSRLADRDEDSEELREWLFRALFFRPLDLRLIEMVLAIARPEDQDLMTQLASLAADYGGVSDD